VYRTHFATKVSTTFVPNVRNQLAMPALDVTANSAGHIPAGAPFTQALFRFLNVPTTYTVYAGGVDAIDNVLTGSSLFSDTERAINNVPLFASRYGSRFPRAGPSAKASLQVLVNPAGGISEHHATGTDAYLSLWSGADGSSNLYVFSDSAVARGTKCLAGICLQDEPILYMYR